MDLLTIILTILTIAVFYLWFSRHDPQLPPCPCRPLPVVGHLLYLENNPRTQFEKWRKKCGDIYSLYLGPSHVVVLNGYDVMTEVLVKNGAASSDRPYTYYEEVLGSIGKGIAFTSGELWKEQRSEAIDILRNLGMGRNIMAERVSEIAGLNNEMLASLQGEPTNVDRIISISVANVICSVIIGHRFEYGDKELITVYDNIRDIMNGVGGTAVMNYFRFLKYLPIGWSSVRELKSKGRYIMDTFVEKYVKRVLSGESNTTDNFIVSYVQRMNKQISAGEETTLSMDNLIKIIFELFIAGVETSTTTILWFILYMLHYPEVQEKVYLEIESVIGTERPINISDRTSLPYLNAAIMETQRLCSIVPLSLPHKCSRDISVKGFIIPKGAQIFPNLDSVLLDENTWGNDASSFRPERFLDQHGKLLNPEELVPFSLGKRICLGEALAKMELFLFLGNMMQRFQFVAPCVETPPPLKTIYGITVSPAPFEVKVMER